MASYRLHVENNTIYAQMSGLFIVQEVASYEAELMRHVSTFDKNKVWGLIC